MSTPDVATFVFNCEALPMMTGLPPVERINLVRDLIETFYLMPGNGAGGSLHCVLDDGNWETVHVEHARDYAREHEDFAGVALAELLLTLTEAERWAIDGPDDDEEDAPA